MTPELQKAIEQCRTAALAAQCIVAEVSLYLEIAKEEAEGWRRRSLIVDSQIERQETAIRRLEAVAAAWEVQLATIVDLDRLDLQVKKLTTAIIREEADNKKDPWGSVS